MLLHLEDDMSTLADASVWGLLQNRTKLGFASDSYVYLHMSERAERLGPISS